MAFVQNRDERNADVLILVGMDGDSWKKYWGFQLQPNYGIMQGRIFHSCPPVGELYGYKVAMVFAEATGRGRKSGHQPLMANQAGSGMVLLCFPSLGRQFLPGGNYILSEVPKVDVK